MQTMRGLGKRIASEVTTAIITIAPLPDVQPDVRSQNNVPEMIRESVVRQSSPSHGDVQAGLL